MNSDSEDPPGGASHPPRDPYGLSFDRTPEKPGWHGRLLVLFISGALFAFACACPALTFKRNGRELDAWTGLSLLKAGWIVILSGQIAWYANVVTVLSLIFLLCRRWLTAMVIAQVALGIAANALLLFWRDIPADASGNNTMWLAHLGPGFYFWVASMVTVVGGASILRRCDKAAVDRPAA